MNKYEILFEPKFVHFMWDNSLVGKKCFVANSLGVLMCNVIGNDQYWYSMVDNSGDTLAPFKCPSEKAFIFAYYDPDYEVKKAFLDGKTVQRRFRQADSTDDDWRDAEDNSFTYACIGNDHLSEWRIKPEQKLTWSEISFRPFKNCDELVQFWEDNYGNKYRPEGTMPLIWVMQGTRKSLITDFDNRIVRITKKWYGVSQLLGDFTFLDGKPCGVEVN